MAESPEIESLDMRVRLRLDKPVIPSAAGLADMESCGVTESVERGAVAGSTGDNKSCGLRAAKAEASHNNPEMSMMYICECLKAVIGNYIK